MGSHIKNLDPYSKPKFCPVQCIFVQCSAVQCSAHLVADLWSGELGQPIGNILLQAPALPHSSRGEQYSTVQYSTVLAATSGQRTVYFKLDAKKNAKCIFVHKNIFFAQKYKKSVAKNILSKKKSNLSKIYV